MGYWEERLAKSLKLLTDRNIAEVEEQMKRYYKRSSKNVIGLFESVYNKVTEVKLEGREPSPADLYKLDKYWKMQGQLNLELQRLGNKQIALLTEKFYSQFTQIYEAIALKDNLFFGELNKESILQMINSIWCADGKTWSSRIWANTDLLQQALNDNLLDCVLTGKKPNELRKLLQKQFEVSFSRADALVRTELAHIQTQAAQKRYEDYGVTEVEILVDEDERTCPICSKLEGKRYPIHGAMPVPVHPRCRCCVIPVVITEPQQLEFDFN